MSDIVIQIAVLIVVLGLAIFFVIRKMDKSEIKRFVVGILTIIIAGIFLAIINRLLPWE